MATPFTPLANQGSIGATEHSLPNNSTVLTPQTTAEEIEVVLDFTGMAAGDQYRARIYEKANGGTQAPMLEAYITGPQTNLYYLPPRRVNEGWDVTLKLMAGSASTVKWSLKRDVGDRNVLTIANGAIAAATFAANAITSSVIAASAIGASQLGAAAITAAKFATDAIDANALAANAATEIAAVVWATISEGAETFGDAVRLIGSRLFGKATVQDGDGAYTFRDKADTKNRIAMTRTGTARTVSTRDGT